MNLDRYHYIMLACIGFLIAFAGNKDRINIKQSETWLSEKKVLEEKVLTVSAENKTLDTKLQKSVATRKKITPIVLPNGQIAYITEETSDTVEEAISSMKSNYQSTIDRLTKENSDLASHTIKKETDIVKSAPFWNAVLAVPVLGYADITQYQAGGGINLGPLSVSLTNPLTLSVQPRIQGLIRF